MAEKEKIYRIKMSVETFFYIIIGFQAIAIVGLAIVIVRRHLQIKKELEIHAKKLRKKRMETEA